MTKPANPWAWLAGLDGAMQLKISYWTMVRVSTAISPHVILGQHLALRVLIFQENQIVHFQSYSNNIEKHVYFLGFYKQYISNLLFHLGMLFNIYVKSIRKDIPSRDMNAFPAPCCATTVPSAATTTWAGASVAPFKLEHKNHSSFFGRYPTGS